jgi:hypothetical protein
VFDQYHYSSSESVSVGAVICVAWNVESGFWREYCSPDCSYVYVVGVEEQGKLCFFVSNGVGVPGFNT